MKTQARTDQSKQVVYKSWHTSSNEDININQSTYLSAAVLPRGLTDKGLDFAHWVAYILVAHSLRRYGRETFGSGQISGEDGRIRDWKDISQSMVGMIAGCASRVGQGG